MLFLSTVVGGVVGSNAASKSSDNDAAKNAVANGAIATDPSGNVLYPLNANSAPLYPSASLTAAGSTPSVGSSTDLSCGSDPFSPASRAANSFEVRSDHPRLFAPAYRWSCLPQLIGKDPYLAAWNETIFSNASRFADMDPQPYTLVFPPARVGLMRLAGPTAACPALASLIRRERFSCA
jgi:hypothetical protein